MIIHAEGFEVGSTADLQYKGLNAVGTSTKAITTGRNSPFGFRNTYVWNPPAGQSGNNYNGGGYDALLRYPVNNVIMGFAFRLNSPWNRNQAVPLMGLFPIIYDAFNARDNVAPQYTNLYIAANGQLVVVGSNQSVASPSYTVPSGNFQAVADTWYYLEVQIIQGYSSTNLTVFSNTATIRINGTQVGTTTFNNAVGTFVSYFFTHARLGYAAFTTSNNNLATNFNGTGPMPVGSLTSTFSVDYDDWYVLDASRQPRANFLGPVVIKALRPTSDIVTGMVRNTGSSNFSAVADSTFDSDTTYVTASNVGDTDVYGVTTLTGTGVVYGVSVTAATKQVAGSGRFAGVIRSGGVNYLTEYRANPSTSGYVPNRFFMETVPTAAKPDWDVTTVNSTGFGLTYESQN